MKPSWVGPRAAWASLALGVALGCTSPPPRDNADLPHTFAHAFGLYDHHLVTNSLEAFRTSYERGCRFMEVDLWVTPDHHLVLFHDGHEKELRLPERFTWADFMASHLAGKYTPLDADRVADLLAEKPDWMMLADSKNEQPEGLRILCEAMRVRGLDCRRRLIPHLLDLGDGYQTLESMGFARMVLALYRLDVSDATVVQFVRSHPRVVAVNIPSRRWSESLAAALKQLRVKTYVHTVDDPDVMEWLASEGAWGVITDDGCPSANPLFAGPAP